MGEARKVMTLQHALTFLSEAGYIAVWRGTDENGRNYINFRKPGSSKTYAYGYRLTIFDEIINPADTTTNNEEEAETMTRKELYTAITAAGVALHSCNAAETVPEGGDVMYYLTTKELTGIYADITEEQTTETEEEEEEETMSNTAFTPAEAAMHAATVRGIIRRQGGYRERDILNHPHTIERGTWTTEHKVVEILSTTPDPDGYRPGCAVDIVTRSIVG